MDERPLKIGSPAWSCVLVIKAYRCCISPFLPPSCRYVPTCSQYALDALTRYGVFRGIYLTFRRIVRCHPFSKGGYDPVQ